MKSISWIKSLIVALLIVIFVRSFIISNYIIDGHSMTPTLHDGDRVLVNQLIDVVIPPQQGDIYFFKLNENEVMVKRIVATPGDYLKIYKDSVYINGQETTFKDKTMHALLKHNNQSYRIIPNDCYIVLGDNVDESVDSRTFGCIRRNQFLGKVIYTYWNKK
ncbi:signal peptidase I [Macrococcoides caseolyticum]|uniref:signal peptidase I n=1 Tax=Macrococcoides caseolyticum TaxID=69966 RepID=UPI001F3967B2|nr:signal peptidase I [Macrococcus caseolyticus]MCE4955756.1 signal peptidase I [Macrococcus caseolyticus]